jgi:hypothetical protein
MVLLSIEPFRSAECSAFREEGACDLLFCSSTDFETSTAPEEGTAARIPPLEGFSVAPPLAES